MLASPQIDIMFMILSDFMFLHHYGQNLVYIGKGGHFANLFTFSFFSHNVVCSFSL